MTRLKRHLRANDITVTALAKATKLNRRRVSDLANGRGIATDDEIAKITASLGVKARKVGL